MRGSWRWGRALLSVAAVGVLLVLVVPLVAGAPWSQVAAALSAVSTLELLALLLLWAGGLVAHTFTLTAALPRLTHRRALALSLTGSAVANVLPFGGAAGVALNYRMTRTWGFDRPAFAAYTVVTNVWDVLVKLCLPARGAGGGRADRTRDAGPPGRGGRAGHRGAGDGGAARRGGAGQRHGGRGRGARHRPRGGGAAPRGRVSAPPAAGRRRAGPGARGVPHPRPRADGHG